MNRRGSSLPYPAMLPRERVRVRVYRLAYPDWSYQDIARRLNDVYGWYNQGCRSRAGVRDLVIRAGMRMVTDAERSMC